MMTTGCTWAPAVDATRTRQASLNTPFTRVSSTPARFRREDIHSDDAILQGHAFLRCSPKTVEVLTHGDIFKADVAKQRDQLCLRQSAGDSTGPEVDVAPDRLRELARHDDVPIQELAAWLENPKDLAERLSLVRRQAQDSIGDHEV